MPIARALRFSLTIVVATLGLGACSESLKLPTFDKPAPNECDRATFVGDVVSLTVSFPGEASRSSMGILLSRTTLVTAGHSVVRRRPLEPLFDGELEIARRDAEGHLTRVTRRFRVMDGSFLSGSGAVLDSARDRISFEELQRHPDYAVLELDSAVPWAVAAPIYTTRAPRYGDVMAFGIGLGDQREAKSDHVQLSRGARTIARVWTVTRSDFGWTAELIPESGTDPAPGWSGTPVFLWEDGEWHFWGVLRSILHLRFPGSPQKQGFARDETLPETPLYRVSAAERWH